MNVEKISFNIISNAGEARNLIYDALDEIKDKNYDKATDKIKKAESLIFYAHEEHVKLITEEAKGNKINLELLLIHAMDILMAAESERDIAKKIMEILKSL